MIIFVFDRVENIVEKEENAGYQPFLLFPQCFEKALSHTHQKVSLFGNVLTRVNSTALQSYLPCCLHKLSFSWITLLLEIL